MKLKQDWLDYLKTQSAVVDRGDLIHFDNPKLEAHSISNSDIITVLGDYGVITASGDEAAQFLQNQFSNDVRLINDKQSQLSSYCSPKGRVISLFRLIQQNNQYYMLLPKERLAATLKRLKMFILRTKVTLEDDSEHYGAIGVSGSNAMNLVNNIIASAPGNDNECVYNEQLSVVRVPGIQPRFLIFTTYEKLITIWSNLKDQATPVATEAWRYLDIQAGIPEVYDVNSEEFVPQMINLHSLHGVSFQKGCYPGQEVVARMHYLGKQKRRMYLAHTTTESAPQPGDNVYTENDPSGQSVGKIVSSTTAQEGGFDTLIVMQIKSVEERENIITKDSGMIDFKELPYFVEVEGKK